MGEGRRGEGKGREAVKLFSGQTSRYALGLLATKCHKELLLGDVLKLVSMVAPFTSKGSVNVGRWRELVSEFMEAVEVFKKILC